jgi:hypothetical protein
MIEVNHEDVIQIHKHEDNYDSDKMMTVIMEKIISVIIIKIITMAV